MNNNDEIQKIINRIMKNLIAVSDDFFLLQNNLKQSGFIFNNKVFSEHKDKSINRLGRLLRYAQEVFKIREREY